MPRAPRKTTGISDSLNRQLTTYAQVATATGVAVLALAGNSDAKVIYTQTNQVTRTFPLYIDLNHDGINDFFVRTSYYAGSSGVELGLSAQRCGEAANAVAGRRYGTSGGYFLSVASALRAGAEIGPERDFFPFEFMGGELFKKHAAGQYSEIGPWAGKGKGVKDRYLGLKFVINGEVHYGWARFNVSLEHDPQLGDVTGTLTGYAYETVPGKPIVAGQTAGADVITAQPVTLGGLALGKK